MNRHAGALCALLLVISSAALASGGEDLRDPTRPLTFAVPKATAPKLILQAIFQRQSGREAIVNGRTVRRGDTVAGARIDKITQNGIVYSYRGQQQSLRLRPAIPGIKQDR